MMHTQLRAVVKVDQSIAVALNSDLWRLTLCTKVLHSIIARSSLKERSRRVHLWPSELKSKRVAAHAVMLGCAFHSDNEIQGNTLGIFSSSSNHGTNRHSLACIFR